MQDNNKTLIAKDWILKLANGINPLDGNALKEDDIVNNVHISRCLFYVAELLDYAAQKAVKKGKTYDSAFFISTADLSRIFIAERTGIANFAKEINKVIPENMKPLSYNTILNWLVNNGYLEEAYLDDGKKIKRPTPEGVAVGISAELKEGTNGPYWAVEYNPNAQRFILNNIYAIIEQ